MSLNIAEFAVEAALLQCRSLVCAPQWKVYISETKWEDGNRRPIVIFECTSCHAMRYLDLSSPPAKLSHLAELVGADQSDSPDKILELAIDCLIDAQTLHNQA